MLNNEMPGCRIAARSAGRTRLRSAVVKSAVLGVPAAALLLSAGVASAATTQHASPEAHAVKLGARPASAANVTWHNLTLINGWQDASGQASPLYAISNGVVYLAGGLTQPSPGGQVFAVLPKAARPSHAIYRSVDGFAGTEVTLFILPNGEMQAYSTNPTTTAQQFTSLSGVSWPVAGTTWHKLNLINGWVSANTSVNKAGDPAYAVKNGIVYLSGSVKQTSGSRSTFAVLPTAARAGLKMYLTDYMFQQTRGSLVIYRNGQISALSGPQSDARSFTSLSAISYPAKGITWHHFTLKNGWTAVSSVVGAPAYAVRNGIVYLSGALQSGSSIQFARTPAGIEPPNILFMPIYTSGGSYGYFAVGGNPRADVNSSPFSNAQTYASLAAISYPVNS